MDIAATVYIIDVARAQTMKLQALNFRIFYFHWTCTFKYVKNNVLITAANYVFVASRQCMRMFNYASQSDFKISSQKLPYVHIRSFSFYGACMSIIRVAHLSRKRSCGQNILSCGQMEPE